MESVQKKKILEICCGSYEDVVAAEEGGADRVELNQALFLGGLTPAAGTLRQIKKDCSIKVIAMVRPRGCGFCYNEREYQVMLEEARSLLEDGADGIAFGFLQEDGSLHSAYIQAMVSLIHGYQKEAVFHRAFDCTAADRGVLQGLMDVGIDRVLTSGGAPTAEEGIDRLRDLQAFAGDRIELLAGCGVREDNALRILEETGLWQLHSSCKDWKSDPTTNWGRVSYDYAGEAHRGAYDIVSKDRVRALRDIMQG